MQRTISQICSDNKLKYANHVKILPGMKVVRLLGTTQEAAGNTTVTNKIFKIEKEKSRVKRVSRKKKK